MKTSAAPTQAVEWRRRGERLLPFAAALAFHVLLLAVILNSKPPLISPPVTAVDVSLIPGLGRIAEIASFSLPAVTPVAKKSEPTVSKTTIVSETAPNLGPSPLPKAKPDLNTTKSLPQIVADIVSGAPSLTAAPVSINAQLATASPAPAQTAGGARCELLEALKFNLQSNAAVKTSLLLIPKKSLSVANAILLWNGRWIDQSEVGGPAVLGAVEQAVAQTVSLTSADCQGELLHGVRFITLGDARDTMVLAFGSADWRWSDLTATLSPSN